MRRKIVHLFGKKLFIRLTVRVFHRLFLKFCVCPSLPIEGRMRDVIVLIPDHCLSFYFRNIFKNLLQQNRLAQMFEIFYVALPSGLY